MDTRKYSLKVKLSTFMDNIFMCYFAVSALTLLVGLKEKHLACKSEWWDAGMVIWSEVQVICTWFSSVPLLSC